MLAPSARVPTDELALVRGGGVTDMTPPFKAVTACMPRAHPCVYPWLRPLRTARARGVFSQQLWL